MDNIFGVGLPELILIVIIAGIVLGPERIVVGARWLGRTTSQLQVISRSFFQQLNAEIDGMDPTGELKETMAELNRLRQQVDELRTEFIGVAASTTNDIRKTMAEIEEDTIGSIAPPSLTSSRQATENGNQEVFRPPSLLSPDPEANGSAAAQPPPSDLPQRLDPADDPE